MISALEYNQEIYDFVKGDQHSWKEIYAWGYDDQEKVLPSEPGPARDYFTDEARLRKAIELYLPRIQQKLTTLTDTILSKQAQEKQILLETAEEIATGRFDGIVNVGTPDTLEELGQYTGLVRIARGLHQFLGEGKYDLAVMGRIPAFYHSLSQ